MGSSYDKLQAVLNSKNKIRDKIGLAPSVPFAKYAENVNSTLWYECTSVTPTETLPPVIYSPYGAIWVRHLVSHIPVGVYWKHGDTYVHESLNYSIRTVDGQLVAYSGDTMIAPLGEYSFFPMAKGLDYSGDIGTSHHNTYIQLEYIAELPSGFRWYNEGMYGYQGDPTKWSCSITREDGRWHYRYSAQDGGVSVENNYYSEAVMPFSIDGSTVVWEGAPADFKVEVSAWLHSIYNWSPAVDEAAAGFIVDRCTEYPFINGVYSQSPSGLVNIDNVTEEQGAVYLVKIDNRWVFASAPDGGTIYLEQSEVGKTASSAAAIYVVPGQTTSAAVVRPAAIGELPKRVIEVRKWTGNSLKKTPNEEDVPYYNTTDESRELVYKGELVPEVGHIYSHDCTAEAIWLNPDIEPPYLENETGGSAEYYLCTYVNRTYETGEFTVSGLPDDAFKDLADWEGNPYPDKYRTKNPNGTYAPYYKEGELSGWKFRNEHGTVCYWSGEWMAWVFAPFAQGEDDNYWLSWFPARGRCEWENMKYPWDPTIEWVDGNTDSPISGLAIAPVIPPPVEPYWNGYKLIMNENGKYDINYSEELKLTYADFMPVAGRFYDSGCSVEIGAANLEDGYYYSTPTNMTSNENAEWKISASHEHSYSSDTYPAYQAFDGTDKNWNSANDNSSNTFIQWQNKKHKVLLKQLDIYAYDWEEMPKLNEPDNNNGGAYIEGSNDGSDWKQLTVTLPDGFNYSDRCASFKLAANYEFFSYHRIRCNNGTRRWVVKEIKGTYLTEREVPK